MWLVRGIEVPEEKKAARRRRRGSPSIDAVDRRLMTLLGADATASYADLSSSLNLSAPAVHERVKRLKRDGVIRATVALLDPVAIGRPLLAFVQVSTTNWDTTRQIVALSELSEVEEIHTVAGDTAMILKVRTADAQTLEALLGQIRRMDGFGGTKTYIALSTNLERSPCSRNHRYDVGHW